jgi:cation diffusion facilitator family transporter
MNEKKGIAISSVGAAVFLTGFKLVVGIQTNSLGILSEAAHSGLDLMAAVITLIAVTIADRPADHDHQYGHGKVENLSAFVETILLVLTCGWIMWEAIERLMDKGPHVEATIWSFVVMGVSIVVDISRSRALSRVAKKYGSQALEADALHFSSDIWSSLTVIAGLVFVSLGYPKADSIVAMIVALLVLFVSYRLGRRTIDALMDRVPSDVKESIEKAIATVEGVEEVKNVRIRYSGPKTFVDTVVGIPRTLPFQRAHTIMDNIEKAVHAIYPSADVVVHGEPHVSRSESIIDKIRMVAVGHGLRAPHNLEVHLIDGKYFIDFDLEYQKGKSFSDAHDIASEIERQIRHELSAISKVTIHMEEFLAHERELSDVTRSEQRLAGQIQKLVERDRRISRCSDLTLLQEGAKYNVTLSCKIKKEKTLEDVHMIISELETDLYKKFRQIRRVTIHAEPK